MSEMITSLANPLIKQVRALRQKKAREEGGLFLAEGLAHVGNAFEAGWEIHTVLFAPERLRSEFGRELLGKLELARIRCQPVSAAVFESFAEKENPQGIVALVRQRQASLDDVLAATSTSHAPVFIASVSPQDPGNVGAILRTLDAIGGAGLFLLDGGVDPFHPSCVRASMGAIFHIPFAQASFADFVAWSAVHNLRLVATSARATSDYRQVCLDGRPMVIVLGSEQKGLSAEQLALCPERVSLPMRGKVSSLNLAVAAGILLYAFGDAGAS